MKFNKFSNSFDLIDMIFNKMLNFILLNIFIKKNF